MWPNDPASMESNCPNLVRRQAHSDWLARSQLLMQLAHGKNMEVRVDLGAGSQFRNRLLVQFDDLFDIQVHLLGQALQGSHWIGAIIWSVRHGNSARNKQ